MDKYSVTIAEDISYKQFTGYFLADTELEAKKIAKEAFDKIYPIYSARSKIILCSKLPVFQ